MTAPDVLDKVNPDGSTGDEDLLHVVCECSNHVALCGLDMTDTAWAATFADPWCPLCVAAAEHPCPNCGR